MARSKGVYLHKWDIKILEQLATSCNIASNARTQDDWKIFLKAVYDAIHILDHRQRVILLLSQEVGMALVDIARILNMPLSTVVVSLKMAVDKVVCFLKSRSLTRRDLFESKVMKLLYSETIDLEECLHEASEFPLNNEYYVPWFYPKNYLIEAIFSEGSEKGEEVV